MNLSAEQWGKLNDVVLQCGAVHEPKRFCAHALECLRTVVPFDQARVYFLDNNAEVFDQILLGVSKSVTRDYHAFYASADDKRYSAAQRAREYRLRIGATPNADAPLKQEITVVDWSQEPDDTVFYRQHLQPQGIRFSTGFCLFDDKGHPRALFCLDRTRNSTYSETECDLLALFAAHLDNLYRNFYASVPREYGTGVAILKSDDLGLTEREAEIVELVMRGSSTKKIAALLGISRPTVYRHIANIHAKLGVSSQTELINVVADRLREAGNTLGEGYAQHVR